MTAVEQVRAVRESLPASHEWDEREASLLALAEAQARDIEALEAVIAERGIAAKDSWRLNAAVSEVRQARVALARILGQIDIPRNRPHELGSRFEGRSSKVGELMARLRDRTAAGWRYDPQGHDALDIILNLLLAPTGEYSEDQLRIAW